MSIITKLIKPTVKSVLMAGVAASALTMASVDFAVAQGSGQGGGQGGGSQSAGSGGGSGGSGSGSGGSGGSGSGGSGDGGAGAGQGGSGQGLQDDAEDGGAPGGAGGAGGAGDDSGRPEDKGGRPEDVGGGDEDSDRPDWAGVPGGSADRGTPPDAGGGGDLYGDLYVILRDDQGVPVLSDAGFVQPVAEDGTLIPLDEEGHVIDETLVQEVDIGRLNVSRAPEDVLAGRSDEIVKLLNNADAISFDPAGRLIIIIDGEESTIDSPLENLAIYTALMDTGSIDGVDNPVVTSLFLADGKQTDEDLEAAAAFLAAATDKSGVLTTDEIAYINLILGIAPDVIDGTEVQYSDVDFTDFSYDREDTYDGVKTTILVQQDDGSWLPEEIDVYETVFNSTNSDVDDGTIDAFTQAADDARMVINYIHEYAVPVVPDEL